jgi:gamma-glutamyltranspeptidase/glutathione hydrolase
MKEKNPLSRKKGRGRKFRRVLKITGLVVLGILVLLAVVYAFLPKGPRDLMIYQDRTRTEKSMVVADSYAAVTGTPWATGAAISMLEKGGNAYDAAAAALLMLQVTNGVHSSFPSVAPVMIFDAAGGQVRSYIGAGTAPAAATLESFRKRGWKTVPPINIWSQLLPASPDVMIALLQDYGTLSFSEVSAPAIQLAREGFPATKPLLVDLGKFGIFERLGYCLMFPYNGQVWFQGECWRPLQLHDRMRFPDLADTFQSMADAEQAVLAGGGTRQEGLQAVRDLFYRGTLAEQITAFEEEQGGLITAGDLASYQGGWEQPVTGSYGAYTFYTNSGWSQGMVGPLALQILEGIELKSMGQNSPEYIHTVVQAIELAQADRDAYVADPAFVDVPWEVLMSKEYAAQRRESMTAMAFGPLPSPGVIPGHSPGNNPSGTAASEAAAEQEPLADDLRIGQDTTQLAVVDRWGNAVVMTPSDFPWTRMVPGTGINLGNRMNQFRLDPENVDVLAPGKRPRITPHAVIVFKDGQFYMAYSTPGGDMQPQALVQVFLNMAVFDMDLQQAIDAPRFYTISAPSSFAPHEASPGTIRLEADLYDQSATGLQTLGYTLVRDTAWNYDFGGVGAILRGTDGRLYAGADPRWETWAEGK